VVFALISLALSACSPVQPWERGTLAKSYMALESSSEQNILRKHIYSSREASSGSGSSKGGGCGCN
jgi:hypothetical protein